MSAGGGNVTAHNTSSVGRNRSGAMLPNLLVVGVPKAGTTSLFSYLGQHPDICASRTKEIGYFSPLRQGRPLPPADETYRREFGHWSGERYRLEATPSYCYSGERLVAGIQDTLAQPKIILSLREPVERLWSAYTFQRTKGNLGRARSFEDYLYRCRERHRQGRSWAGAKHLSGLSIGYYGAYIDQWLSSFSGDIRVIFTDDLFRRPRQVMRDIYEWLTVDINVVESLDISARLSTAHARNTRLARWVYATKSATDRLLRTSPSLRGALKRTYLRLNTGDFKEVLQPDIRHELQEMYRESNRATAAALMAHGYRRLPDWLQNASPPGVSAEDLLPKNSLTNDCP